MSRLQKMFASLKGAAFMPYVCCGDPNEKFTVKLVKALAENGADAIEFGIPFSDPIADGKAIQAASQRALASGMTPKRAIATIARLRRERVNAPIVAMTYYNIVFSNGEGKFLAALKRAGADGLIVPDVPLEEAGGLARECKKAGIDFVRLITPNCGMARLRKIAAGARGFLYAVAVFGTTGARKKVDGRRRYRGPLCALVLALRLRSMRKNLQGLARTE
jgi:tryptophan synthase alpha chain